MPQPLYLRYTPNEGKPQHEVELKALGESLLGFTRVTEEYSRILGISGELVITATYTREGSLVINLLVELQQTGQVVFETAQHLYDFLKITSVEEYLASIGELGKLKDGYETIEDYYTKHPIQLTAIIAAITLLIRKTANQKSRPQNNDSSLPQRMTEMLHELVKTKTFRGFLQPIVQDCVESIEISDERTFKRAAKINQQNFQDYLPDDEQILPLLLPDTQHTLNGTITSMKSTRGDSLTLHYVYEGKAYNLDLLPEQNKTTKAYTNFYKEQVNTTATVIRDSMFKKPKLRIESIEYQSPYLLEDEEEKLKLKNWMELDE